MSQHPSTPRPTRRRPWVVVLAALAAVAGSFASPAGTAGAADGGPEGRVIDPGLGYPNDDELRLNEVQVVGTHNSYHLPPVPEFDAALNSLIPGLTSLWQYEHRPLPEQFADLGIRQIELDVFADPDGGLYADRVAQDFAGVTPPPEVVATLEEPGLKVLHVQEVDVETTCLTFVICLGQLEAWSDANPGHLPVMVLVELKDDPIPDPLSLGFPVPVPFDADQMDVVDAEIRSVFDAEDLLTPDDVRGSHPSLSHAVEEDGWPTLGQVRGKVMFGLDNGGAKQDTYLDGHPSAAGRVMFPSGSPVGAPEAAFLKLNDPIGQAATIEAAVEAGYMVRTRADSDSAPGDVDPQRYTTRDAALATGAQFVSTDFPEPDPAFDPDYDVVFDDGARVRCNPLVGPEWCQTSDVEDPSLLVSPEGCDPTLFPDVPLGNTFCPEITWLVANGLADGYPDGTFRPTAPVSRQAMAAYLYRASSVPEPTAPCDSPFPDVPDDHRFCHEITWLVDEGVADGYDDGTFRPTAPVSRQAAASFLHRLAGTPASTCTGTYPDVPVGHRFCEPIDWLTGAGVAEGYDDGTFRPTAPVSRQATAAFLARLAAIL